MAVAIRLTRVGATKRPAYRVVAIDKRRSRDGRALEILGYYDPLTEPATVRLETEKIKAWIGKGAQPSDTVVKLMRQAESTAAAGTDAPAPKRATRGAGTKPSRKAAAKAKAASEAPAEASEPAAAEATETAPTAETTEATEATESAEAADEPQATTEPSAEPQTTDEGTGEAAAGEEPPAGEEAAPEPSADEADRA